jgi:hypothetical protein
MGVYGLTNVNCLIIQLKGRMCEKCPTVRKESTPQRKVQKLFVTAAVGGVRLQRLFTELQAGPE